MLSQEEHLMIKYLDQEGLPKAQIARRCGVSRQTVYNHLRRSSRAKPRPKRASKLDPFKDYLRARLDRYDLPATVLWREIRAQGYAGGLTILRDYVRPLKEEKVRTLTERFETIPGQQAQCDWGECGTVTVDGVRRKLYLFVLVLGYSRMLFARFTTSTKLPALLDCLREGFGELGIPRELVVDNMKQAVDGRDEEGVRFNGTFLDFCEHHGTQPWAAPPYWPRVKGKVERGVGYVKESFLEGRSFVDLDDLNRQLDAWLAAVANVRVHGTTGERPYDRHRRELDHLRPLAAVPVYDVRPTEFRRVNRESHIRYGNVLYSVDPDAVGQTVAIKAAGDRVGEAFTVCWGERVVAEHRRAEAGSGRVTLDGHAAKIRAICRRGSPRRPRKVRFEQREGDAEIPAIAVQTRSLAQYERLLQGAGQ